TLGAEVGAVPLVHEREDAAAHRHARLALVSGLLPRLAVRLDLLALLNMQRLAGLVRLQRGALQMQAELRGPLGRRIRARAPPDALAQPLRMRLHAQKAGRIRE